MTVRQRYVADVYNWQQKNASPKDPCENNNDKIVPMKNTTG